MAGGRVCIEVGDDLATFEDELLLVSSSTLFTYSSVNDDWANRGTLTSLELQTRPILKNNAQQAVVDSATSTSGITLTAWEDSRGGIRYRVEDVNTGATYITDSVLDDDVNARIPKVISRDTYIYVFYTIANTMFWKRIVISTPTLLSSRIELRNDVDITSGSFDVHEYGAQSMVASYYNLTQELTTLFINFQGEEGSIANGFSNRVTSSIDAPRTIDVQIIGPASDQIAIAYTNDSGSVFTVLDSNLVEFLAPTVIDTTPTGSHITGVPIDETTMQYFTEISASSPTDNHIITNTVMTDGVTSSFGPTVFMRSLGLASEAFFADGLAHVNAIHDSTLQSTVFTVQSDTTLSSSIVAKAYSGRAGGVYDSSRIPSVHDDLSGSFSFPNTIRGRFQSEAGDTDNIGFSLKGLQRTTLKFGSPDTFDTSILGDNLHFGGGVVNIYDGQSIVESGFHIFPEDVTSDLGAGSLAAGTYQYAVTYDWVDNKGQRHQSADSTPITVVAAGSNNVTLTIPTLRITNKKDDRTPVTISVWRTEDLGTIFFKVSSDGTPTENDPDVDSITFTDELADTAILTAEILYTVGGQLENIGPPASSIVEEHQNRIFLAGQEDRNVIWFSKKSVEGVGTSFSDLQTLKLEPEGGDITALGSLDERLIIFKRDSIHEVGGDGPNVLGGGIPYNQPRLVTTDVGCTNNRSIVVTPQGLMFESAKGIYLLNRQLQSLYIGAPVEAFKDLTITSATLIDDVNQIRFTTSEGRTLVYDYFFGQWSTFTNQPAVDGLIFDNSFVYLKANGRVFRENLTKFKDDTDEYRLKLTTSWIKLSGIQGFQRVRRSAFLGDFESAHQFRVRIHYDYEPFFRDTIVVNPNDYLQLDSENYGTDTPYGADDNVYGGTPETVHQFRIHNPRQKCEAIKFTFEDILDTSSATASGEGYKISHLELELGGKRGIFKMSGDKSKG